MFARVFKVGFGTASTAAAATFGYAAYSGVDVSNLDEMSTFLSGMANATKEVSDDLEKISDETKAQIGGGDGMSVAVAEEIASDATEIVATGLWVVAYELEEISEAQKKEIKKQKEHIENLQSKHLEIMHELKDKNRTKQYFPLKEKLTRNIKPEEKRETETLSKSEISDKAKTDDSDMKFWGYASLTVAVGVGTILWMNRRT